MLIPVLILAVILILLTAYIMGKQLTEQCYEIENAPDSLKGKRAVIFSDVHISRIFPPAQYEKCCRKINSLHPDYIFFAGDFAAKSGFDASKIERHVIRLTGRLAAPCGKYAVLGNNDYIDNSRDVNDFTISVLENGGFEILCDSGKTIADGVYLAGLSSHKDVEPDIDKAVSGRSDGEYTILLSHQPDIADRACHYGVDLQFSGHTHGGQIKIPFLYKLFLPIGGKKYISGYYKVRKTHLFVTNGAGLHTLPFRFLAPADITVIDFVDSDKCNN